MNSYADLTTLKTRLAIPDTNDDTALLQLLNATSRQLEKWCGMDFYVKEETRYFEGTAGTLYLDDLLSIVTESFKLDFDGDGTFEETLETTDYILYPLNSFPKTRIKINPTGSYAHFARGVIKGVEIDGKWGYGDGESATPYEDSGDDLAAAITSLTATTFTVDTGGNFAIGQTIKIDDEQMYISGISGNTITVKRGVNGTDAATHLISITIYIYKYPEPIFEACMMQAMRWWKRKDSAFSDMMGGAELGTIVMFKGLDADVKLIVEAYKKILT